MDTDAAGIHHNTAIVRFVEAAEASLMREHGLAAYFLHTPRVHYDVDFESPLHFGQELTVTIDIARIGATSMTFTFEVWGEEFEERPRRRAAHGRYVIVHIEGDHADSGGAVSSPWPGDWLARLRNSTHAGRPR